MSTKIDLTNLIQLRGFAQTLTSDQLVVARDLVQSFIEERHRLHQQKIDERNQKQMRGLMAKAGISWEEFQDALK